ncbi:yhcT [Symbiodinium natans]|uniref:YhcT protein n=1 Tax=Symbiodinium natans TaxID=878477 RepID=A0A812P259_9DINO|nr:yhcT [Symbiodinium natans]
MQSTASDLDTVISYSAALSSFQHPSQWQRGTDLFQQCRAQSELDIIAGNSLVAALEGSARWREALHALRFSAHASLQPDRLGTNTVVSAAGKAGKWHLSLSLFRHMAGQRRLRRRMSPDHITYSALVQGFESGGAWQRAWSLLSNMGCSGCRPNALDLTSALEAGASWPFSLAVLFAEHRVDSLLAAAAIARVPVRAQQEQLLLAILSRWRAAGPTAAPQSITEDAEPPPTWPSLGEGLEVLKEVPGIVVVMKPAGIRTEAAASAVRYAASGRYSGFHLASRLDSPTSGVLPIACGPPGSLEAEWLQLQFAARLVHKEYWCLCQGTSLGVRGATGEICSPLRAREVEEGVFRAEVSSRGRPAHTMYEVLSRYASPDTPDHQEVMLLRVKLLTGRTHQIRVHMASIGRPLIGDVLYGLEVPWCSRLFLHCRSVRFRDLTFAVVDVDVPLPPALCDALAALTEIESWSEEHLRTIVLALRTTRDPSAAQHQGAWRKAINAACRSKGGHYAGYSCKVVSWDDVSRGTVGGSLSCWGANITDTYLKSRSGTALFTVRSENWDEKLGVVGAQEVAVVAGKGAGPPQPVTLRTILQELGAYGKYAGLPSDTDLSDAALDAKCSIRFQTTFLPVEAPGSGRGTLEFATEAYNYNTREDSDPRNLLLLCTSQGIAVQQDGRGKKRLFHHATDGHGKIHRYWLEAEESQHRVGGPQEESVEERADALRRGKATSSVIGIRAMGKRFNVLMTIQVPLKQRRGERKGLCSWQQDAQKYLTDLGTNSKVTWGADGSLTVTTTSCYGQDTILKAFKTAEDTPRSSCRSRSRSRARSRGSRGSCSNDDRDRGRDRGGRSSAARVSRGSEFDVWPGLSVKAPKRHDSEHVTITVVVYNVVQGGVPSTQDVLNAIDDLEMLYKACSANSRLADSTCDFMKQELTVQDMCDISCKMQYQPPTQDVQQYDVFPAA